jgi:histone-lysine N-methyltransferase ASH1L
VPGDELTIDYDLEMLGTVAQPCYCGARTCRGTIGR